MAIKPSGRISRVTTGLLLVGGLAVLTAGVTVRVADLHFATVLSNSMQPTFSAGDVVVTQSVPTASLRVGDVITFIPPTEVRAVIHRIRTIQDGVITTRGDANSVADPWHLTLSGPSVGRLVAVLPFLGWLTQFQRPAFVLAALLLILALGLELRKEVGKRLLKSRNRPEPQA